MEMENVFDNLSGMISKRLISIKQEDENAMIINRAAGPFFQKIFKESLFKYDQHVLLVERIFNKDYCKEFMLPFENMTDDGFEKIQELVEYTKSISSSDIKDKSEEEIKKIEDEINQKIQQANQAMEGSKSVDRIIMTYSDTETKSTYPVIALSKLTDSDIEIISKIYANFILSYVSFCHIDSEITNIVLTSIGDDEYKDLIVFINPPDTNENGVG